MRFFQLTNFWHLVIQIQLFLLAICFLIHREKQNRFWLRMGICFVVSCLLAYFYPGIPVKIQVLRIIFNTLQYILFASLVFFSIKICYKVSWTIALFVATGSYAIQHLFSELDNIALDSLVAIFKIEGDTFVLKLILVILFSVISFFLVYFVTKRKRKNGEPRVKSLSTLLLTLVVIIVDITLSSLRGRALRGVDKPSANMLVTAFSLMASFLIVVVVFSLIKESDLQNDIIATDAILKKEREQWERSKELTESINIKFHDLKHRLRAMRKSGSIDPALLKDIENDISLYDATVNTGNEAVDVLLNERLIYCKNEGILFSTMVDGACLSFIELSDLYSLLGNAISNAIEAVMKIEDREKRVVNLIIKKQQGFVSIHMENYFLKIQKSEDGNLLTTKEDAHNHGFGVKSMIRIVEKYGGTISLTQEGDIFLTDILLPSDA